MPTAVFLYVEYIIRFRLAYFPEGLIMEPIATL